MSKQETVSIAAAAVQRASTEPNFAEILNLWLSLVYDTAALVAWDELKPKRLPNTYIDTKVSLGCYLCGLGAGGKVTGVVCMRSNCPTRVSC